MSSELSIEGRLPLGVEVSDTIVLPQQSCLGFREAVVDGAGNLIAYRVSMQSAPLAIVVKNSFRVPRVPRSGGRWRCVRR